MIKKTLGGNMSNIARFMTDTKYSEQRKTLLDSLEVFSDSIREADFEFELTPELRV